MLVALLPGSTAAAPAAPQKQGRVAPPPGSVSRHNLATAVERLQRRDVAVVRKAMADTVTLVALRVDFPDLEFGESPPAELHDQFYYRVQFRYLQQYYAAASNGRLHLRVDVPDGTARALQEQEYYGNVDHYDSLMVELTAEAVGHFDPSVDFSAYDGVITLHAGPGQESDIAGDSPFQIWSGYIDQLSFAEVLSTPDSTILGIPTDDDHLVRDAVILPEWEVQDQQTTGGTRLGHLGVYAHETGQKLGMIPLFDADPSPIPNSQGIGNFGVMGYGLWVANGFIPSLPCAFNRMLMDWVDPIDVASTSEFELRDYERGAPDSVVARIPISAREYFLVSYIVEDPDGPIVVQCSGEPVGPRRFFHFADLNENCLFDFEDLNGDSVMSEGDLIDDYDGAEWNFFMTDLIGMNTAGSGFGLLVLHVDEQVLHEVVGSGSTNVQRDPRRKAVDVEEADTIEDLDRFPDNARSFGSFEDYFLSPFTPQTIPDTRSTNGAPTGLRIDLVALPDSSASPVVPAVGIPGGRARVRVQYDAVLDDARSPRRRARRVVTGAVGADLVALPQSQGAALVVPGESGEVHLLDADLGELPSAGSDPSRLEAWLVVPPERRGAWFGAPAVGDVDGDGESDVVLVADADSAGTPIVRLFGWRRDGSGLGDPIADPVTGGAQLATLAGRARRLLLYDLHDDPGEEIVVVVEDTTQLEIVVFPPAMVACPTAARVQSPGWEWAGGPVGVRWQGSACAERAIAWAEAERSTGALRLRFFAPDCCEAPVDHVLSGAATGVRMVAGDLDGDGADEIVVVDRDGVVFRVRQTSGAETIGRLGDLDPTPLALADVDANGTLEILVATREAMHVLSFSGALLQGWPYRFRLDPRLEPEATPGFGAGTPLAIELDADGRPEVLLHLRAGPLLVWSQDGARRAELETALPATGAMSPLVADLDDDGVVELVGAARFDRTLSFQAEVESLVTAPVTEFATWTWAGVGASGIAWGEWGGGARHAFHSRFEREVPTMPNDVAMPTFVVAPNPARDVLQARVALTAPARVECSLYNLEGEQVDSASRDGGAGEIVEFRFDVSRFASGIYLARMQLSSGGTRVRPVAIRR
jgi:M6 family metalloprotease-like protein